MSTVSRDGVEIIGAGSVQNFGMRHGVVVNIDQTTEAIRKAREEAELMSGQLADKVWVSVGGTHIESFDSSGMVAIRGDEVQEEDIHRVIEVAKAVALPSDRQVLHVLPKEFKIDDQEGISDPIGMSGVRLECQVHIVTANRSIIQNLLKCIERAGLKLAGLVLQQYASAEAVLTSDEKNLGVALVDIGGGTSDIISFRRGSVVHTQTIPVGGMNFTHDVATGLRTTQLNAETIKTKFGCALPDMIDGDETMEVESVGGRPTRNIPKSSLCQIIEARAEETLKLIQDELARHDLIPDLGSGVILTGGASELTGLVEMGDFIFDMPVRAGLPKSVGGLTDVVRSPRYATALGLIIYAFDRYREKYHEQGAEDDVFNKMNEIGRKIKNFFARSL
jgi:cell division protein FtsA